MVDYWRLETIFRPLNMQSHMSLAIAPANQSARLTCQALSFFQESLIEFKLNVESIIEYNV